MAGETVLTLQHFLMTFTKSIHYGNVTSTQEKICNFIIVHF